jgi:hypothetical protein
MLCRGCGCGPPTPPPVQCTDQPHRLCKLQPLLLPDGLSEAVRCCEEKGAIWGVGCCNPTVVAFTAEQYSAHQNHMLCCGGLFGHVTVQFCFACQCCAIHSLYPCVQTCMHGACLDESTCC